MKDGTCAGGGRDGIGAQDPLRRPDGIEFDVGSGLSDAQRSDPPRPGTTVTYRYRALTARGLPRFATFVRVRED